MLRERSRLLFLLDGDDSKLLARLINNWSDTLLESTGKPAKKKSAENEEQYDGQEAIHAFLQREFYVGIT